MDRRNQATQPSGSKAFNDLADLINASGGPSEGSFANIRALKEQQQEQQRRAGATRDTQPRTRVTVESPSAAAARVAWEEARARRLAAEAAKAQVEERLKNAKSSGKKASPDSPQGPMASAARSTPHLSKQKPPKPSKVSSMFHNLVLGLNVQARPWEAPTKDLIALEQARRSLGNQQFILDKRTKVLKGLLNEVRARGGDDADTIKVLRDLIYRKISEEEAEKRLKAFEEGKKTEDKGMTLAEKEELARLEIKAQQLTLQKLAMERREEERKEVEEIQKRIREKGLPIKLSRPTTDPYAACYRPVHGGVPAAIDDFAEEDLFGDGGSAAFRLEDEMFGPGQDLGLRRAHTLDGRSRGLNEQLAGLDQLGEYDLDGESMLYDDEPQLTGRLGQGQGAAVHPLQQRNSQPKYETLGNTGLPKFNRIAARKPKRAQSTGPAVNFRIQPNDPRLDPRSPYYKAEWARAFRNQQLRDAQQIKLAQQAEAERAQKLELEKKALQNERAEALVDAQMYQERKLQEEARVKAAQEAAKKAHEAEILRKRQQLQKVRSLEEILAAEEQLNYLEDLLRTNPRAAIPGFDTRRLQDEPNLLPYVLNLVEENIRRPEAAKHSARLLQESLERERADRERREKLFKQEQDLNRLEALLTQNPQATIKGLDMSKLNSDPEILQEALRQVEAYIQRGENPLEIPLPATSEPLLNEARTRPQLSDQELDLIHRFLIAAPEMQVHYLRTLPNHAAQGRFLAATMQVADLARAQQLIERFNVYGFNLVLQPDAASRPPLMLPTPPAAQVPTIVVEEALSPPPTQDTAPAFPFPDMRKGTAKTSGIDIKGKGREIDFEPTYIVIDNHSTGTPHLPSPPINTPGRTSATHPSAAATAAAAAAAASAAAAAELLERQQAEDDLAAQEAELERERQEIVEAEEALKRAEIENAMIEAQKRADEEALEALRLQDELRMQAAAEMEAAAQAQAREMAEAEKAVKDAWADSPPPPADLADKSPILDALPTPLIGTADPVISTNDPWGSPLPEAAEEPANIENDPVWGEASAQINNALKSPASRKTASPVLSRAASIKPPSSNHSSPKASSKAPSLASVPPSAKASIKAASPAGAWSALHTPVTTPKLASDHASNANDAAAPAASIHSQSPAIEAAVSPRAGSLHSEIITSPMRLSAVIPATSSPVLSVHSTPKAITAIASSRNTPLQVKEASPLLPKSPILALSPEIVATPKTLTPQSTPKAATPRTPSLPTPKTVTPAVTPKASTPVFSPKVPTTAGASTPVFTAKVPTPAASPKNPTPQVTPKETPKATPTAIPKATPPATFDAWGAASVKTSSPAPARSRTATPATAKSRTPQVVDAWGSPVASVKAGSSLKSPVAAAVDAWSSPKVSPTVAKSPSRTPHQTNDIWGAASPARTTTPHIVPAASPKATSPTESTASKASAAKAASVRSKVASPAFGLVGAAGTASQVGQTTPEYGEGPKTAIKGSDPVVVSMAEPITPYEDHLSRPSGAEAAHPEAYPEEGEYEEYSEEGHDDFDPADFPIYMTDEPLDPGYTLAENPAPHPFQERYPKGPEVTEEALLNHFAGIAHQHGFHAIFQCNLQELPDSYVIQGYMVNLRTAKPPSPPAGGPFDIPDKNAGKATVVSDASTPGWL